MKNFPKVMESGMLVTKNAYIRSVYQHLQVISQDEEKWLEYEAKSISGTNNYDGK